MKIPCFLSLLAATATLLSQTNTPNTGLYIATNNPSPPMYIWPDKSGPFLLSNETNLLVIQAGPEELLKIKRDGRIEVKGEPDATARLFLLSLSEIIHMDNRMMSHQTEILEVLKFFASDLRATSDTPVDDLIYRSPPDDLRYRADKLEQRDAMIRRLRALLKTLEGGEK